MMHRAIVCGVLKAAPGGIGRAKTVQAVGVIKNGDGRGRHLIMRRDFIAQTTLFLRLSVLHLVA